MLEINENIYGHKNRLDWFKKFIKKEQSGLEFGCGTGTMITGILSQEGYCIRGIDLDTDSINLGKEIFTENNISIDKLICDDLKNMPDESYDYIIASEVFEHIPDEVLDDIFELIKKKIKPNGLLLVTVPNGYGWFEFEDFIWKKLKVGYIIQTLKINSIIGRIKKLFIGEYVDSKYPSSIADSPHVQRFTLNSIINKLENLDFKQFDSRGSTLFSGPFSNMFFTGIKTVMYFNIKLGEVFPSFSSGFYIAFKK